MGRPLPDRLNVIITRQTDYQTPPGIVVVHSLKAALDLPEVQAAAEVFIIGGAQIYDEAMPLADKLYLTIVHATIEGDTFFRYDPKQWQLEWSKHHQADTENKYAFTLQRFGRK
jgi:dihydrofolate reductase